LKFTTHSGESKLECTGTLQWWGEVSLCALPKKFNCFRSSASVYDAFGLSPWIDAPHRCNEKNLERHCMDENMREIDGTDEFVWTEMEKALVLLMAIYFP